MNRTGAYAKLLANYAEDDAIIEAGERAEILFVRGLAFCADSDSDGFITDRQLQRYVGIGLRSVRERAEKLVSVGLWLRVADGYIVRSWTKLHETAEQRGRKRKADRERKASKRGENPSDSERTDTGIQDDSERTPDGAPPDSLSDTEQNIAGHGTAEHYQDLGENRNETLRESDATELPPDEQPPTATSPVEARCTNHRGVTNPPPCTGCGQARERAEKLADRAEEKHRQAEHDRIRNCPDCWGSGLREDDQGNATGKCHHPKLRRAS